VDDSPDIVDVRRLSSDSSHGGRVGRRSNAVVVDEA
jgi:hypothetical protein